MGKIILGCVADDFTGASDAASFLIKEGIKTYLFNGIPKVDILHVEEDIAVVIALKTRSQVMSTAVLETLEAFKWLEKNETKKFFIKYCSTFDSTKTGNIGPIIDSVLESYNIKYTILCPALPVNGRIVYDGKLFVNGIPLHESHMKNHPLTPMWESDIAKLMETQGKYQSLNIDHISLKKSKNCILDKVGEFAKERKHFYIIPDYIEETDAEKIVDLFGDLKLLTGSSGLMSQLAHKIKNNKRTHSIGIQSSTNGKAVILAGSCSNRTLEQIEHYKNSGGIYFKIDPIALLHGTQTIDNIWSFVKKANTDAVLLFSSDNLDNIKRAQIYGSEKISNLLEETMAEIAKRAIGVHYNRIIVAGGETAGAVIKALGYDSYLVGESISPGVPIMIPLIDQKVRVILKSGNFGQIDFFTRAIKKTKN